VFLPDIRSIPFVGMPALLHAGDAECSQAAPDDHDAAAELLVLTHLPEGRVGSLLDQDAEPSQVVAVERGLLAAAMRSRGERTGLATELKPSGDVRDIDLEPAGDVPAGALAIVDGCDDPLPEVSTATSVTRRER
jgi:hypothetical protein